MDINQHYLSKKVPKDISYQILKFLRDNGGVYREIDLQDILVKLFPLNDMFALAKIQDYLDRLASDGYVELINGRLSPKETIDKENNEVYAVFAKEKDEYSITSFVTVKGIELLDAHSDRKKRNTSFYFTTAVAFITLIISGWNAYFNWANYNKVSNYNIKQPIEVEVLKPTPSKLELPTTTPSRSK